MVSRILFIVLLLALLFAVGRPIYRSRDNVPGIVQSDGCMATPVSRHHGNWKWARAHSSQVRRCRRNSRRQASFLCRPQLTGNGVAIIGNLSMVDQLSKLLRFHPVRLTASSFDVSTNTNDKREIHDRKLVEDIWAFVISHAQQTTSPPAPAIGAFSLCFYDDGGTRHCVFYDTVGYFTIDDEFRGNLTTDRCDRLWAIERSLKGTGEDGK